MANEMGIISHTYPPNDEFTKIGTENLDVMLLIANEEMKIRLTDLDTVRSARSPCLSLSTD